MFGVIYRIINIITNDFYIGSTNNPDFRWASHLYELVRNEHFNRFLQRAWNKYGSSSFRFEILEHVKINVLRQVEQEYIDRLEPKYNLAKTVSQPSSRKGETNTPEHNRKISNALRGRRTSQGMTGHHHKEETKQKIREKAQIQTNRDTSGFVKGREGHPLKEETKQKIREARSKQTNVNTSGFSKSPTRLQSTTDTHRLVEFEWSSRRQPVLTRSQRNGSFSDSTSDP